MMDDMLKTEAAVECLVLDSQPIQSTGQPGSAYAVNC